MNNLQPQQLAQMQMLADVNVLMNQKDFKHIPSGWEMSNVVLQFFVQSKGNLKLWLYFWLPTVMPKINLVEFKVAKLFLTKLYSFCPSKQLST